MRKRHLSFSADTVIGDLFASAMLAVLLLLVIILVQSKYEAQKAKDAELDADHKWQEVKVAREVADVYNESLRQIQHKPGVNIENGRIVLATQHAFEVSQWEFRPTPEERPRFEEARRLLKQSLSDLDRDLMPSLIDLPGKPPPSDFVEVHVVGHTDCQPYPEGSDFDNYDLSALRAAAVVKFLTEEGGIDGSHWTVLPAGRADLEPSPEVKGKSCGDWCQSILSRDFVQSTPGAKGRSCADLTENEKAELKRMMETQRRITLEIVLRLDKIMVLKENGTPPAPL